jgi:flagellar hook-length control protein FliK
MNPMSASMTPSPAGQAAPAAAALPVAAMPGMPLAAPFSEWLGLVAQAGQEAVAAAGELDSAEPAEAGSQDGAAPPLALADAALAAMTQPITMPAPAPAADAALAANAAPLAIGAPDAPERFAEVRAPLAAPDAARPGAAIPATMTAPAAGQGAAAPAAATPAAALPAADTAARFEAVPAAGTGALALGALAPAPAPGQDLPTVLKLSGTPPDWQQPLREALGERLQLQLGRNADQAVIRLDPPMLGRIEISIRHAGGALEVNISATHGEVLRQLNTISDSMRNDLAQRQFTEVAVSVVAAPRSGAAPSGEQQGRQRQSGAGQDEAGPGRGLAEAGQPSSAFSLNGRESTT